MIKLEKFDNLKTAEEMRLGGACVVWELFNSVYASPASVSIANKERVVYFTIPRGAKILGYCNRIENGKAIN